MTSAPTTTELDIAPVIDAVRSGSPLVHCITNTVVTNFTANALLAAGASPAMVDAPQESGILASVAGALLINLGTVTSAQAEGMRMAIAGANVAGVPWVLDPVAIGALPMRTALAREFAGLEPAVIRETRPRSVSWPGVRADVGWTRPRRRTRSLRWQQTSRGSTTRSSR